MSSSQLIQHDLQNPSQQNHHVGRCQWKTWFDGDRQDAWQLQELLSHWTNNLLKDLLEQQFSCYCPKGYTWRIDQITLDLGSLDYSALAIELPKRVSEALTLQLQRLLQFVYWVPQLNKSLTPNSTLGSVVTGGVNQEYSSQLLDSNNTWQAFVGHYLRTGTLPWWYRGPLNHQQVMRAQLTHAPIQVAVIIRQLGRIESVRKRLVWQYYPDPLNPLIRALEPYHHEVIEQFADHLIDFQQQKQLGGDRIAVARQSWYWILTHMLVERGSIFNTTVFVISTLQQMAHHHQLNYSHLLMQMLQAAKSLKQRHSQVPVFIQALLAAGQQLTTIVSDNTKCVQTKELTRMTREIPKTTKGVDYWQQFEQCLHGKENHSAEIGHLAEIFVMLARKNAHRMAVLLRKQGQNEAVKMRIINAFGEIELATIVVVLMPSDHVFVLNHVAHIKKALAVNSLPSDTQLLWHMVLSHLLKNHGSYFNRSQFVNYTLRHWSQARGLDYGLLLDLLSSASSEYQGSEQRIELMVILAELKQLHHVAPIKQNVKQDVKQKEKQQLKRHNQITPENPMSLYRQNLYRYLFHGQIRKTRQSSNKAWLMPAPQNLLTILLYRDPEGLAITLREGWVRSHHSPHWLSRLMALLTLADTPVLFRILALYVADWLLPLLALDSEQGDEIGLMLLLSHPIEGMSIKSVLTRLKTISPALVDALQKSLFRENEQESKWPEQVFSSKDRHTLLLWFKQQTLPATELHHLSIIEQIVWLLRQSASGQVSKALPSLTQRLDQTLPNNGDALIRALQRDSQSNQLVHTLLRQMPDVPALKVWLLTLWPKDVMPASVLLPLLSKRLQASGLWQGSITRLEQLLNQQIGLTVLTQAMSASVTVNAFWRHLVLGLTRPLALSSQQIFSALIQKSANVGDGIDTSDDMARSIKAALFGNACLQVQSTGLFSDFEKNISVKCIQGKKKSENNSISSKEISLIKPYIIDAAGRYLQQQEMPEVLVHWLCHGRAPLWWVSAPVISLTALLADVLAFTPSLLVTALCQTHTNAHEHRTVVRRLANLIDFSALLTLMGKTEPTLANKSPALSHIDEILRAGLLKHIRPALGDLPNLLLWQYTIDAWLCGGSGWQELMPQAAVNNIYGQLIHRYPEIKTAVVDAFAEPFAQYLEISDTAPVTVQTQLDRLLPPLLPNTESAALNKPSTSADEQGITMPIAVSNAGLVIIHDFIKKYFSKLGLSDDHGFVTDQAQWDAVHWLQMLATGCDKTDETHMVLNKVLCGLPLSTPVATGIEVLDEQQELAEGLIDAVIKYWPAIGSSSIEGFRGNWLVRDGLLRETEEHWELVIEKRPYDLLLERLPFGFSLVRLPWMDKPLYVTWPT